MTSPPAQARTGNEQRIAAMQAEIVTMRQALEQMEEYVGHEITWTRIETTLHKMIRSALSSSADYANKVVVDREEWEAMNKVVEVLEERNMRLSTGYKDYQRKVSWSAIDEAINNLWVIRSLRQQGGGG